MGPLLAASRTEMSAGPHSTSLRDHGPAVYVSSTGEESKHLNPSDSAQAHGKIYGKVDCDDDDDGDNNDEEE